MKKTSVKLTALVLALILALALALTGSRSALLFGGILLTLCCVYLMRSGVISRRCLVLLAALPSRFGMAGFLIAAVPVALAFGGTIPQLAALIMAFFGPRHFGVNYGFSTSPLMVASVCGPFIGGLIRAWSGDYLVALYVAAAITLLGVAPAVVLREKAHKRESVAREGCPSPASLSSQNG